MLAAGGMRQSLKPDTIRKKPTTTRNANGNSQDFCGIWDPVTFSTNVETVWVSYCRCRALYDSTVLKSECDVVVTHFLCTVCVTIPSPIPIGEPHDHPTLM